jgi:two-component system, NtrC family, response regulator HydG
MCAARRVLILDDEVDLVEAVARYFESKGHVATRTYLVEEAVRAIEDAVASNHPFRAIITDLQLPDGDGRTVVRVAREKLPRTPVLVMTGSGSVSGTAEAIHLGAVTVLEKPVRMDVLEQELEKAVGDRGEIEGGVAAAEQAGIIGRSPAIRAVLDALFLAAPTDATVLIEGETGTGKELVARAVHRLSRRSRAPFVAINCAALPETLVESELFGHVKGAFTGADKDRSGCFQQAHGGTLFLDEIGEMPLQLQAKLLRAIQEGEVQPLGATKVVKVDVRIVAATNRALAKLAAAGRFRADLYYRLNVVPLYIPPLRDRAEDVPVLAAHFLAPANRKLTPDAAAALSRYAWPGNVREMENLIQRLLVLKPKGDLDLPDLPPSFHSANTVRATPATEALPPEGVNLYQVLADLEDRLIREALERTGGNRNQAAQALGIKRTTLVEKLRKMSRQSGG